MKLKPIVLSTLVVVCGAGAFATSALARSRIEVVVRPPEPRVVVVPRARAGYVWAPGYWRWNGRRHDWVNGRWMREHRGSHWVPSHWEEHGERWRFEEGHWER